MTKTKAKTEHLLTTSVGTPEGLSLKLHHESKTDWEMVSFSKNRSVLCCRIISVHQSPRFGFIPNVLFYFKFYLNMFLYKLCLSFIKTAFHPLLVIILVLFLSTKIKNYKYCALLSYSTFLNPICVFFGNDLFIYHIVLGPFLCEIILLE